MKKPSKNKQTVNARDFFANSDSLDHMVLRPLSHIEGNWELSWDKANQCYITEEGSFAAMLNSLISELDQSGPPENYHDNEDSLAEYVIHTLKWSIHKVGGRWVGDYQSILEQGGIGDANQKNLVLAAAGRILAARNYEQVHFDEMELGHQKMLGAVLSIILYHRS